MPQNIENTNYIALSEYEKYLDEFGEDTSNLVYKEHRHKGFAYDNNVPIPGEKIEFDKLADTDNITEDTALDNLIIKSAIYKAKTEKSELDKKREEERIRKQIIDMILYNEGEAFYQKHKCMMDGKSKRRVRRIIEKNYDAGKYNYLKTTSNLNEP